MKTSRLRPFFALIHRIAASIPFHQKYTARGKALSSHATADGIRQLAMSPTMIAFTALYTGVPFLHAAPIEWSENGHYYEKIDGSFTWAAANAAANASSFMGRVGHLVTVTSAAENLFLTNTYGSSGLHYHWLGGIQPAGSPEPSGGWSWDSGEPFTFNNWASGEPNNTGGSENRIVFDHGITANGKSWNDLAAATATRGYIVEYEPDYEDPKDNAIFWFGDQATCDSTQAPHQGSFHAGNNWLNYLPPGPSDQAAFYSELPEPLQSRGVLHGAFPYTIYFDDFNDDGRLGCNDAFFPGGPTTLGSVVIGSGSQWEFYFNSPGAPPDSAPLTVLGDTTIAYDPSPNPPFRINDPYRIPQASNPKLHIHSGTMNSASVTIGGTSGSALLGSSGSGELKIASDAVLSSPSVTVAQGGVLSGKGRIIGPVNVLTGGKVAPGNSEGALTIQGDLTLAPGGEVSLEVAGLVPGESYDQLIVEGTTQLAGTVRLKFVNGFAPVVGDSFEFFGPNGFTSTGVTVVSDSGVQIAVQGNRTLEVAAIPTPPAEYQQWRQSKFGNTTSREGEPRANPDGDSSDNFNEFIFNLNPIASDYRPLELGAGVGGIPVIGIVQEGNAQQVAFEFIRHKRFGPYLVQTSTDLQSWTTEANPVLDSIVSVSADYERVRIVEHLPMDSGNQNANRRFYRIVIECQPPSITTQLAPTTIYRGDGATLSVAATGTAPLTYQWYRGNSGDTTTPVGTGGASYTTPALTESASYWVRVSNGAGTQDSAAVIVTVQALPQEMVFIPAGSFMMGQTSGDTLSNAPAVSVTVSSYLLGRYEVTKVQWDEVRSWALANGYTDLGAGSGKSSNHPIQTISWWDAVKWCNARSEKEGLDPVYWNGTLPFRGGTTVPSVKWDAKGYRLPTEAEWEKAARGGISGKRFPWGTDSISHSNANYFASSSISYDLSGAANNYHPAYRSGSTPYTAPVGSFAANGYGLYDMAGNVWELCWDWYSASSYVTGAIDPKGAGSGTDRVSRGGGWRLNATYCRASNRIWVSPTTANHDHGFRIARSPSPLVGSYAAPSITTQPSSTIISSGSTATLSVIASGTAPLTYQWYEGVAGTTATPVGSNSASFTTPEINQATNYWVRVTNSLGSVNSTMVVVTIPNTIPNDMILIPAGAFTMGRTSGDADSNAPTVNISLNSFYAGKYEVTKGEWDEVRSWAVNNGYTDLGTGAGNANNHPVQMVSWWDVIKWCNARSQKEGLVPCYMNGSSVMKTGTLEPTVLWSENGYRLPTEAEWEKAARGGVGGKRYPWGSDTISHNLANYYSQANYSYDLSGSANSYHPNYMAGSTVYTAPVGSFVANGYGFHDMTGNVWEWCWDWHSTSTYVDGVKDPRGPATGTSRVGRGGGWGRNAADCRVSARATAFQPSYMSTNGGLRLFRSSIIKPRITTQPASATIISGVTTTLTVAASGTGPLSYQWYQGTVGTTTTPVGTNSSSFTTLALTESASYWVRVSNAAGTVDSTAATVTVNAAPPTITTQPASTTITSGSTATLSVVATGTAPLSYQWYQGAVGITTSPVGANSESFTTPALTATTTYWVRVSNVAAGVNSALATVTVAAVTTPTGFSLIPAGAFTMGDALDGASDAPTHTVNVSAFYMAQNLVTKEQWDSVRTWAVSNGYSDLVSGAGKASNHPVQAISWFQMVKWCNARSQQEGLTPVYYTNDAQTTVYNTGEVYPTNAQVKWTANGYRLPTESEWEKAARGGLSGKRFPWGDTISHDQANYYASSAYSYDLSGAVNNYYRYHPTYETGSTPYTSPVGSFAANGYGLYDMAGNVEQWCWDWYGASTYVNGATDPRGANSGRFRVFRGGSWVSYAGYCRVASRGNGNTPNYAYYSIGFRVARSSVP